MIVWQITEETDTHFKLEFEHQSDFFSQWVSRDSPDIAPMDSKKKYEAVDEEWYESLQPGDMLDCMDPYDKWCVCGAWHRGAGCTTSSATCRYNATVSAVRMTTYGKEVHVVYRVYWPYGEKMDPEGRRYVGWQEEYDEWVSFLTHPHRFARFNRKAGANAVVYGGAPVDDSKDEEHGNVHAVYRDAKHGSPCVALAGCASACELP